MARMKLDLIQTVAFAGIVLFLGYGIRRLVPPLARYNIPAPVIGGLIVAGILTWARATGTTLVEFDTTLQGPLMVAFFTSIGFAASFRLLKVGGPQVLIFFAAATAVGLVQNLLGAGMALAMGAAPAVRRADGIGDDDGRTRHGAGVRAAVRGERRSRRGDGGRGGGGGGHPGGRPDRRARRPRGSSSAAACVRRTPRSRWRRRWRRRW